MERFFPRFALVPGLAVAVSTADIVAAFPELLT